MDNYKKIAARYMKKSLGRSIFSILGVGILSLLMYMLFLPLLCSFDVMLNETKKNNDYHMYFYLDNKQQAEEIINEKFVKKAWIGKAYSDEELVCENALYLKINNPYLIDKKYEYISSKYSLEGKINDDLAYFYFQGKDGMGYVMSIIIFVFLDLIIAIGGIGLIRNSIFLYLTEYIKDFGMLRCIGGTKRQIRKIFARITWDIEVLGIILGILLSVPITFIVTSLVLGKPKMYLFPILIIVVSFMYDLFFLVRDITKKLDKLTPAMAVHGNMSRVIKSGKIKARGKGFLFALFGIEGTYAYKNIMRKPRRFLLNICVFTFGIAIFVGFGSIVSSIKLSQKERFEALGEYMVIGSPQYVSVDELALMPYKEELVKLSNYDFVKKVKKQQSIISYVTNEKFIYGKFTNQYKNLPRKSEEKLQYRSEKEKNYVNCMVEISGYDEEDMEMLNKYLVEGSLDIGENEIILVDYEQFVVEDDFSLTGIKPVSMKKYDYKVGDTIDLVDYQLMRDQYSKLEELEVYNDNVFKKVFDDRINDLHQDMVKNNQNVSFKIKAIVKMPEELNSLSKLNLILPQKSFQKYSGLSENSYTGLKYQFNRKKINKNIIRLISSMDVFMSPGLTFYAETLFTNATIEVLLGFLCCIFLILLCNYIINVSANINMRRKEFAQLRILGATKNSIKKIVLIECIVTLFISSILGYFVGNGISKNTYMLFSSIIGFDYKPPVVLFLISTIFLLGVVVVTSIVVLGNMKADMAEDLREEGY